MSRIQGSVQLAGRLVLGISAVGWLAAVPARAELALFEATGITLGDDPVECADLGTHRRCASDAGSERVLSHDGLPASERIPLDFQLFLPAAPANGPDGNYPLVVFIHGWGGSNTSIGGGVESEFVPYAEGGYAVLAYSARAWGGSCGSAQQANSECAGQWNHLADIRYEVRDTQYFAGLLADELSDDGTPLVDPAKIGVTGVSYGGGQSTMLTTLRNRVVNLDGSTSPWTSPAGKPMQIAAAAPYWAWTDLAYALLPNGRTLDYAVNNAYRGPLGGAPFGVSKTSVQRGALRAGGGDERVRAARRGPRHQRLEHVDQRGRALSGGDDRPDRRRGDGLPFGLLLARSGGRAGSYAVQLGLVGRHLPDDGARALDPARETSASRPGGGTGRQRLRTRARELRRRRVREEHRARLVRLLPEGDRWAARTGRARAHAELRGARGRLRGRVVARARAGRGAPVFRRRNGALVRRAQQRFGAGIRPDRGQWGVLTRG